MRRPPRPSATIPVAPVVRLEPGTIDASLRALADRFAGLRSRAATLDLGAVARLDAADLRALGAMLDAASAAGVEIRCAGATPSVYKALHLAKLGARLTRASSARLAEEDSR